MTTIASNLSQTPPAFMGTDAGNSKTAPPPIVSVVGDELALAVLGDAWDALESEHVAHAIAKRHLRPLAKQSTQLMENRFV